MGSASASTWEDRLSELADYRKIHGTAMFLVATVETPSWLSGSQTKGRNTGSTWQAAHHL
jgi:hypothetical protein